MLTRYRSITNAYYKNATGAILVYDLTKKDTFNNIKNWLNDVKEYADNDLTAIMIGNKCDLIEERMVTTDDGLDFAKQEGIFFMEVSALSNVDDCVGRAFNLLIEGTRSSTRNHQKERERSQAASRTDARQKGRITIHLLLRALRILPCPDGQRKTSGPR